MQAVERRAVRLALAREHHHVGALAAPALERDRPLVGAAHVERQVAGADHRAVHDAGCHGRDLPGGDRDHRLVEQREPPCRIAEHEQRLPLPELRERHRVAVAHLLGGGERLGEHPLGARPPPPSRAPRARRRRAGAPPRGRARARVGCRRCGALARASRCCGPRRPCRRGRARSRWRTGPRRPILDAEERLMRPGGEVDALILPPEEERDRRRGARGRLHRARRRASASVNASNAARPAVLVERRAATVEHVGDESWRSPPVRTARIGRCGRPAAGQRFRSASACSRSVGVVIDAAMTWSATNSAIFRACFACLRRRLIVLARLFASESASALRWASPEVGDPERRELEPRRGALGRALRAPWILVELPPRRAHVGPGRRR